MKWRTSNFGHTYEPGEARSNMTNEARNEVYSKIILGLQYRHFRIAPWRVNVVKHLYRPCFTDHLWDRTFELFTEFPSMFQTRSFMKVEVKRTLLEHWPEKVWKKPSWWIPDFINIPLGINHSLPSLTVPSNRLPPATEKKLAMWLWRRRECERQESLIKNSVEFVLERVNTVGQLRGVMPALIRWLPDERKRAAAQQRKASPPPSGYAEYQEMQKELYEGECDSILAEMLIIDPNDIRPERRVMADYPSVFYHNDMGIGYADYPEAEYQAYERRKICVAEDEQFDPE